MNSATTARLLGYLHRVFNQDPESYLALRIQYTKDYSWAVRDGFLTIDFYPRPLLADGRWTAGGLQQANGVDDYSTSLLSIDLANYTLSELAQYIASIQGFSVVYQSPEGGGMSALTLLDGSGSQSESNGDHLYAYTSVLWSYMTAVCQEIDLASMAIAAMTKQMNLRTAEGFWLDELGGYYNIRRLPGEIDSTYGSRIIAETLRPKGNNVAIARAIKDIVGMDVSVTDAAILPSQSNDFDGTWAFDGSRQFAIHDPRAMYGLFDVSMRYDLLGGGTEEEDVAAIAALVNRLRDAGTYLRQIGIDGASIITDSYDYPMTDSCSMEVRTQWKFDGTRRFDGAAVFGPTIDSSEQLI